MKGPELEKSSSAFKQDVSSSHVAQLQREELRVISINVCSMTPSDLRTQGGAKCKSVGMNATGRMLMLDKVFYEAGADIVCVQESRLPADQVLSTVHYKVYNIGAMPPSITMACNSG